jgi:PAS domain S-box-containing protein
MTAGRYDVLLVEDDKVDQLALERFIRDERLPYNMTMAGSVTEARTLLGATKYDVIISDYNIGDGDTFDVIKLAHGTPVVVVTGSGDEAVAVRALKAGAADYMIKDRERHYLRILPTAVENAIRRAKTVEQVIKLTHAVEQGPDSIVITDAKARIEYCNPQFSRLTGYDVREVLGQNPRFLKSGEHPAEFYRQMWETITAGRTWHGELHNRRKDGTLYWESTTIAPIRDQDGSITHYVAVKEDVTERKRTERAVLDSEESFRALAENANDGIMIATEAPGHVYVNRQAELITGFTRDEWLDKRFWEIVNPDDRAMLESMFRRRIRGEPVPDRHETWLSRKDGIVVTVELSSARTTWRGEQGVLCIFRDVTERKRSEAQLADRDRRLGILVQQMPAVLWTVDRSLRFTSSVGAGLERLGLRPGQVVGTSLYDYFGTQDPEYPPLAAHLRALRGENASYVQEFADNAYDSDVQPLHDASGSIIGVIGVAQDITELRRVQNKLKSERDFVAGVLDTVGAMVIVLDTEGRIVRFNRACEKLTGYAFREVAGRHFWDLVLAPDDAERVKARFRALDPGQFPTENDGFWITRDGRRRLIHWTDSVVLDGRGRIENVIGTGIDVTERRQAEAERERLIEELDAFAHTVAHDLKGPVGTIQGFAELLAERGDGLDRKDVAESLQAMSQSSHKMNSIIDELMVLSGVRKSEAAVAPVDMAAGVRGALEGLSFMIKQHRPEVTMPERWPSALGHGPWVEEVWANYLSNAMKYGGRPPRIELGFDADGDKVRFWVRDNGPGLTPEQQARLFVPFTRLHQVRARGQGLGLSIVRRIMEKIGGEAWVESEPGRGSRFGFTLPSAAGVDTGRSIPPGAADVGTGGIARPRVPGK